MVYYETFSKKVLLMAVFLFLILLCIDIVKDTLTKVLIKHLDIQPFPIILKAGIQNNYCFSAHHYHGSFHEADYENRNFRIYGYYFTAGLFFS
jgi:hypothetical protein